MRQPKKKGHVSAKKRKSLNGAAKVEQIAPLLEPAIRELDQQHPTQAAMLSALFERVKKVIRLRARNLAAEDFWAKAIPLLADAKELCAWLADPKIEPTFSEIQADIDAW